MVTARAVWSARKVNGTPSVSGPSLVLGQYELIDVIGKGGAAVVYLARQPSVDRLVAMKVLSPRLGDSEDFRDRFGYEARIAAQLEHDRIVPIYDFGEDRGHFYLVMRYMDNRLSRLIRSGPLSVEMTNHFVQEICGALQYAHEKNVIHRDIKPGNILLSRDKDAFLSDFGMAKLAGGPHVPDQDSMLGTPAYMAPEMWRDEESGIFTDLYALGVTIFEMLRGSPPFIRPTLSRLMQDHLEKPPPPLVGMVPGVSREMDAVINKLLSKRPEDRYGSAQEVAEAFQRAVQTCDAPRIGNSRPAGPAPAEWRASQVTTPVAAHTRPFIVGIESAIIDDAQLTYVPRKASRRRRVGTVGVLLLAVLLVIGASRGSTLMQASESVASVRRDGIAAAQRTVLAADSSVQSTSWSPGGAQLADSGAANTANPPAPSNPPENRGQGHGNGNGHANGNGGGGGHGNGNGQGNGNGKGRGG